ncbi:MAG: transposase [Thioalkalivibrio sp.]|nr:transposase [Thioalkalivibrio sp.]
MLELTERLRPAFRDHRVFTRFRRLAFAMLVTEDRRTITTLLDASGQSHRDWSAAYRVFSRDVWSPKDVFACLMPSLVTLQPTTTRIVASLDDTNIRKTGTHIPGVAYRRDPMSPPFHVNFIRAQRFVQTSVVVPFAPGASASRAIPVGFDHAPSAGKLNKDASDEDRRRHRDRQREQSLTTYANAAIKRLRTSLDATGAQKPLLLAVDGSYTNQQVIKSLPDRTDLVGRIRKDAALHRLPADPAGPGRPALYGSGLTPEEVRQDESVPWQTVKIFGAGRVHECEIKEVTPLLWRKTGAHRQLRLIVIRPLAYRRTRSSRLLYRQPAYLITTDLVSLVQDVVQAYFWRWDIEVNHRDEKQLIGVGDAQVRSAQSAERVPAFAVACYALLLISAANAFGIGASDPLVELPKWRINAPKPVRLSTRQLLRRLREEHDRAPIELLNFDNFASNVARTVKLPKQAITFRGALETAFN